jgi:hypothetical protein
MPCFFWYCSHPTLVKHKSQAAVRKRLHLVCHIRIAAHPSCFLVICDLALGGSWVHFHCARVFSGSLCFCPMAQVLLCSRQCQSSFTVGSWWYFCPRDSWIFASELALFPPAATCSTFPGGREYLGRICPDFFHLYLLAGREEIFRQQIFVHNLDKTYQGFDPTWLFSPPLNWCYTF